MRGRLRFRSFCVSFVVGLIIFLCIPTKVKGTCAPAECGIDPITGIDKGGCSGWGPGYFCSQKCCMPPPPGPGGGGCTDSSECGSGQICCDNSCQSDESPCSGSCSVNDAKNLSGTKISSSLTNADWLLSWTKSSDATRPQLLILDSKKSNVDTNVNSACSGGCLISTYLDQDQESYDTTNILKSGTIYYWKVFSYKKGCHKGSSVPEFISSCDLYPNPMNLDVLETQTLNSVVVPAASRPNLSVDFSANGDSSVSLSTLSDPSYPFQTDVTGVSNNLSDPTTISTDVHLGPGFPESSCHSESQVLVGPKPSCNITTLTADPSTITVGGVAALITAVVAPANGTVSNVVFSDPSGNTNISTVNSSGNPTFTTYATGVSAGSAIITATATMNGNGATCSKTVNITVNGAAAVAWWQVKDGDVTTNGKLISYIGDPAQKFDNPGDGGYPGIPAYGLSGNTNLTGANVSVRGWLVQSNYNAKVYNSSYFFGSIPSDVTPKQMGSSITSDDFDFKPANLGYGYYWYEYDGAADLTVNGNIDFLDNKVILLVKQANVVLNGNITLKDGTGFFLLATGGNISINPSVGGGYPTPNLEGIFVSDGNFETGSEESHNDSLLTLRGTVVAYGGINLQRDLGSRQPINNSNSSAEYFEYSPALDLLFPAVLGVRHMYWQEVAP